MSQASQCMLKVTTEVGEIQLDSSNFFKIILYLFPDSQPKFGQNQLKANKQRANPHVQRYH